jgi:hypothetical protein
MRKLICGLALLTAALVTSVGVAVAAPSDKLDSQVIGNVKIDQNDPTVAYVTARYICSGGDGAHVWASVKQADSRLPEAWLREEGSGEASAAWSSSHRHSVTCDGQWHVQTFTVDHLEFGWGELMPGEAWVQFCVIPPGADPDAGGITWSMRFAAIQ